MKFFRIILISVKDEEPPSKNLRDGDVRHGEKHRQRHQERLGLAKE